MKNSTPCPKCLEQLTIEHFKNFSSPFTMKCPHCKAKLKETKVTPFLLLLGVLAVPLFLFLGITVKNVLAGIMPIAEEVPTALIFIIFCYPIYALYERFNASTLLNKGNLHVKR